MPLTRRRAEHYGLVADWSFSPPDHPFSVRPTDGPRIPKSVGESSGEQGRRPHPRVPGLRTLRKSGNPVKRASGASGEVSFCQQLDSRVFDEGRLCRITAAGLNLGGKPAAHLARALPQGSGDNGAALLEVADGNEHESATGHADGPPPARTGDLRGRLPKDAAGSHQQLIRTLLRRGGSSGCASSKVRVSGGAFSSSTVW